MQKYLLGELEKHPQRLELARMMADMASIGKQISAQTSRAGLASIRGKQGSVNVQDEEQAKLDVYANDLCKETLRKTNLFAALASEEEEHVVDLENPDAKYVIAFDPLDGSSNIDVNVSIGTIFSVHKVKDDLDPSDVRQFFQKGRDQVLAGYILYGASTMLMFSWGEGVHECTLDPDLGEFYVSNDPITLPDETPYYSVNEAYADFMSTRDQRYLKIIKQETGKLRWIGSFVADFHRNLLKGGIFYLPPFDTSGSGNFKPKLRLNYEAKPMAYLMDQAGGLSLAGDEDILDIEPSSLHQRVAVISGNSNLVKKYKETK